MLALFDTFIDRYEQVAYRLRQAVLDENAEELVQAAHEARGMFANIGLTRLAALASCLERGIGRDSPQRVVNLVATIEDALPSAERALKAAIQRRK
jgi:HPt (histidine-containing phosphotransfer) domain-containing protein